MRLTTCCHRARVPLGQKRRLNFLRVSATRLLHIRTFELTEAVQELRRCRILAAQSADAEVQSLYVSERCTLALAMALSIRAHLLEKLDPDTSKRLAVEAATEAGELLAAHPRWPSAHLLKGVVGLGGELSGDEAIPLFDRALALRDAADPLMDDLGGLLSPDRAYAHFGLALLYQLGMAHKGSGAQAEKLVATLIVLLGDSVEGRLLKTLEATDGSAQATDALERLRRAERSIPDRVTPDYVAMFCEGFYYGMLMDLESRIGDQEHLRSAALRYLRLTDVEFRSWEALNLAAVLRLRAIMVLAEMYQHRIQAGEPADVVLAAARAEAGPFVAAFVEGDADRTGAGPVERLERLADGAQSAVDLRTVSFFLDVFNVARALDPQATVQWGKAMGQINAKLAAKLRPRVQTAHAWDSWQ